MESLEDRVTSYPSPGPKLALALSKAQSKIVAPKKNKHVDFQPVGKARVKYSYSDLADVIEAIKGPLSENELAYTHALGYQGEMYGMTTMLVHSSGEFIDTWYPLPDPLKQNIRAQEFGSALTYARRYSLSSLVGIASDDDDDGGNAPETKPPQRPPPTYPPGVRSQQPVAKMNPPAQLGNKPSIFKEDDLDDYLNNPGPDVEPSTIELLRNELYSLVDTMALPEPKVKEVIQRYAPGKNSKSMNEKELDQVINHFKFMK